MTTIGTDNSTAAVLAGMGSFQERAIPTDVRTRSSKTLDYDVGHLGVFVDDDDSLCPKVGYRTNGGNVSLTTD